MAPIDGRPADFTVIWARALRDFYGNTDVDLVNNTDVYHPSSVDDLIRHLNDEHSEFGHDSKSSQFTQVVKGAIGPFSFLTSTVGSTAASAGAAVTRSFDAVGGLFEKLGSFTGRLSEVSHETIPDALVPIYQAMLVSLLNICSLATKMTWRSMKDVKVGESRFLHKLKKITRPAFANIDEYMKQLLMGGNGEVSGAVGSLKTLVENESLMMQAIVVRKATRLEGIAVNIEGLTVQMSKATYDLQADTAEVKFRVTILNQSVDRIELGQKELQSGQNELAMTAQATYDTTSEMKTESAKASKQLSTQLETIQKNLEDWRKTSGSSKQQDASTKTRSAVHGESKSLRNLESSLNIKTTRQANAASYGRIRGERISGTADWLLQESAVQRWSHCEVPLLLVSGEAGYGKTFLASRAIDYIAETHKTNGPGADRGLAYFFFRKGQNEDEYISSALKTMAFAVAQGDQIYAKYLNDALDRDLLSPPAGPSTDAKQGEMRAASGAEEQNDSVEENAIGSDPGKTEEIRGSAAVAISNDIDESDRGSNTTENVKATNTGAGNLGTDENGDTTSLAAGTTDGADDADQAFAKKLSRVNSAVIDRLSLADDEEEKAVRNVVRHWNLLFDTYFRGKTRHVYLVLDGLDECDETDTIALCAAINASSKDREGKGPSTVHVMLLMNSTKVKRFGSDLFDTAMVVPVDAHRNMADLDRYVDIRMATAWSKKLIRRDLYNEVHDAILGDCDGNFLKASLIVDEVTSLPREDVIRSTIQDLPSTLETAMLLVINRLSRQLDEHEQEDLHDILAWVACAKRSLSLAELDALLTVRRPGGARVVDLERRLRVAYVTLFSVTGAGATEATTADERSRKRLDGYDTAQLSVPSVPADPLDHSVMSTPAAQSTKLNASASHDTAIRRAVASMQRSYVALSHSLIAEQIQKRTAQAGLKNFTTHSMQGMVLLGCLDILCETNGSHDKQTSELAGRYCGPYLSDHLTSVDPDDVEPETRIKIAKLLIRLFRDDDCMTRMVGFAEGVLTEEFLNKTLFRTRSIQFMQDPKVQSSLDSAEKDWVDQAAAEPLRTVLGGMAQGVARRWLTQATAFYEDYWSFLRRYQTMLNSPESPQTSKTEDGESLTNASTEEVIAVAEWANLEKNGRWYGRIAVTLRNLERYDDSIEYFHKAIELDQEDGLTQVGLAVTFAAQEKYEDALREGVSGIDKLVNNIADSKPSPDPGMSLTSYLRSTRQDCASWSLQINQLDEALQSYERSFQDFELINPDGDDWDHVVSIIVAYYYTLCDKSRWHDVGRLLERLCSHSARFHEEYLMLYQYLTVHSWLLATGFTTKRFDILLLFLDNAICMTARYGEDGDTAYIVYIRAMVSLRLDSDRTDEGVKLLEAVADSDDSGRGVKDITERELARHYFDRSLQAREKDQWHEVGRWASQLVQLVISELDVDGKPNFGTRDCGHILAAWDRVNGRQDRARECIRQHITYGIDLLDDLDPENDDLAWIHLADAYLAIQHPKLAIATCTMPRQGRLPTPAAATKVNDGPAASDATPGAEQENPPTRTDNGPGAVLEAPSADSERHEDTGTSTAQAESATTTATTTLAIHEKKTAELQANGDSATGGEAVTEAPVSIDLPAKSRVETIDKDKPAAGYPFCSCDGCCFDTIPNDAPLWRCSYCIAEFCVSCHDLIMSNKMEGWNICGSNHDHVYFPGTAEKYPENTVRIDGKDLLVKDWVARLREEWNYPKA
ncbi:hypothetical protein LTR78_009402 [Recurvomyces mirabilis]|uniref:Fungal STAND N-terminal Goodbye domain-containing protein n=1 Tax=Recurvomyces mirabilis TaxID=574656 RepID=A0AAE0TND9_9PEZI|nr:hypothetical protein LTR78_009402 [Recurvomyces mirabilis]KAK5154310.1 hypothetical protein LTS14_006995 [Recurvomyces mirabilis]